MSSNLTTDLADLAMPPTQSNVNVATLDQSNNLYNINSPSAQTITIDGTTLTGTVAGYLTSIAAGTASSSKALVLDSSKSLAGINSLGLSTTSTNDQLSITNTSTSGTANIKFATDAKSWDIGARGSAYASFANGFHIRDGNNDRLVVTTAGNVGIEATTITYKLDVNGGVNGTGYYLGGVSVLASALTSVAAGTASANKALVLGTDRNLDYLKVVDLVATDAADAITIDSSASTTARSNVLFRTDTQRLEIGVRNSANTANPNACYVYYNADYRIRMNTSGMVHIGSGAATPAYTYNLRVVGSVSASSFYVDDTVCDISRLTPSAGAATASKALVLGPSRNADYLALGSLVLLNGSATASTTIDASANVTVASSAAGSNWFMTNYRLRLGTSTDTTSTIALSALDSTVAASGKLGLAIGKAATALNQAELVYNHVGDSSTSNYVTLGLNGYTPLAVKRSSISVNSATPVAHSATISNGDFTTGTSPVYHILSSWSNNNASAIRVDLQINSGAASAPTNRASVGTFTSNDFGIMTNNTSRLVVTSSGNVGVGNTAPTYTLDVTGTARIIDALTLTQQLLVNATAISYTSIDSSSSMLYIAPATYNNNFTTTAVGMDTVSHRYLAYIGTPKLTATNSGVTTSSASSLYIASVPINGTNMAITNKYALCVNSGTSYFGSAGHSYSSIAESERIIGVAAATLANSSTAAGQTDTNHRSPVSIAAPTLSATNTGVITTTASTLYIAGQPSSGTNMAITNPYALYVNGGASYFGGNVSSLTSIGVFTGAVDFSVSTRLIQAIDANQGSATYRYITIGRGYSNYNAGHIAFYNSTTSSTSNYIGIGVYGAGDSIIAVTGLANVGIGNTAPAYKLDVSGTVNATSYAVGGVSMLASALSSVTAGTAAGSKALVLDASQKITSGIAGLSTNELIAGGTAITYTTTAGDESLVTLNSTTLTNSSTAASGTDATIRAAITLNAPNFAATNAGVVTTTASTLYIAGAPATSGSNMMLTNKYALYANGTVNATGIRTTTSSHTVKRIHFATTSFGSSAAQRADYTWTHNLNLAVANYMITFTVTKSSTTEVFVILTKTKGTAPPGPPRTMLISFFMNSHRSQS